MDRFSALTVFRRVVELAGFSAAARDLGLSNAAVSKVVKELESELGAQLIVRTTRACSVTDVGREYYERACRVLNDLTAADEWVRCTSEAPRGSLRVSAPVSFGLVALSQIMAEFSHRYPELRVETEMSDGFVDLVAAGFDLAIRGGRLQDSSLRARKLVDIPRTVCAASRYLEARGRPSKPEDLGHHECLVYTGAVNPGVWRLQSGTERRAVAVSGHYCSNNSLALRDAAVAGCGVAFLPTVYIQSELSRGALVDILPEWQGESQALFAVYPAHRESSLKLRLLTDFLAKALAASPSED